MKHTHSVTVLRTSCITGRIIWLYQGTSRGSARYVYWNACRKEGERIKNWCERAACRRANILRLLNKCIEKIPMNTMLTDKQKAAARILKKTCNAEYAPDLSFYEHITAEREKRAKAKRMKRT